MPHAVGRYFSGNGERLNTAVFDEDRVRDVLGLDRGDGMAYAANQIGQGPTVASWDRLDGVAAGVRPLLAGAALLPARSRHDPRPGHRRGRAELVRRGRRRRCCARWHSWLTIFTMSEDDNEGVFGPPPETGNADRISQQMLGIGPLQLPADRATRCAAGRWPTPTSRTSWNATGWPR